MCLVVVSLFEADNDDWVLPVGLVSFFIGGLGSFGLEMKESYYTKVYASVGVDYYSTSGGI